VQRRQVGVPERLLDVDALGRIELEHLFQQINR